MNLRRRNFLQWTGGMAVLMTTPQFLRAQTYPTHPVRLILGFPPGGAADVVARIMATWLSHRFGQQVIVENKPGAGSNLATRAVLSTPPDGYTLLLIGSSTIVNALLQQPALLHDVVPAASLTVSAFVIAVHAASPAATLADLIAFAKRNPRKLRVGSYGVGTQSHLAFHLFANDAKIDVVHVPYRGGAPLMTGLLGQHIDVAFDTVANSLPHIKSGALRALAVTTPNRLNQALPEVPAATETVPGYDAVAWTGLGVRKGTPPEIVERLNREVNAGLADPAISARLAGLATDSMPYSVDKFGVFWSTEIRRTRTLIPHSGIKLE